MRKALIIAAIMMGFPGIVYAQQEDPPLMDNPPLPWFKYNTTREGTQTFLSPACAEDVRQRNDISVHPCVIDEAEAHRRIAEHDAQQRRDAEAARNTPAARASARSAAWAQQEADISFSHAAMLRLQQLMADERETGRISGYVDARRMHDYGAGIVLYQRKIVGAYNAYRASGGPKTLPQIFAGTAPHRKPVLFENLGR